MATDGRSSGAEARGTRRAVEPTREGFVLSTDARLHYLDFGEIGRPAVVLLHGGSAHAHWWDFFAAGLVDRYRLIAPDLRGHGDSDWAHRERYGLEVHVQDVLTLIDRIEPHRVALVGHSFGGLVAVAAAAALGRRLAALAVIDTRIRVSDRAARFMDALRKLPHPVYRSAAHAVERFRLLPVDHCSKADVLAHVARHAIRPAGDGTWTLKFDRRAMVNTAPVDLAPALGRVTSPILIVRGTQSTIVSHAALAEFSAAAPQAGVVEIEEAHHHVMLDQPERLAEAVGSFLDTAWDAAR